MIFQIRKMAAINPLIIIWCGITKIFCFSDGTRIVVQENNSWTKSK